jgi:hypothetical protein
MLAVGIIRKDPAKIEILTEIQKNNITKIFENFYNYIKLNDEQVKKTLVD